MGVSLTSGWLAWLLVLLGLAGAVLLLARRERWWWLFILPLVVMVSAVAAWVIGEPFATNLFAEPLPPVIMCWIGVGIAGISLAVGSLFRIGWARSAGAVIAGTVVVTLAANQINTFYAQYPHWVTSSVWPPTSRSPARRRWARVPRQRSPRWHRNR